jgi:hypothetical protein
VQHTLFSMRVPWMNRLWLLALALEVGVVVANAQNFTTAGTRQTVAADAVQPLCNPDLIDGTFTFASLPVGEQTISLHLQNTTNAACRLQGQVGASFAVDGHGMAIEKCWICDQNDKPLPYPERQSKDQFLIAPGEPVTVDLHWASAGASCQRADWVDFDVQWSKTASYLFIPSGWPLHICSPVRSSGYEAGPDSRLIPAAKDGALSVSVLQDHIYNDERATLHVELTEHEAAGEQPAGCAHLYTVRQAPLIGMRLDPLHVLDSRSIPEFTPVRPYWTKDRLGRCDIEADNTTADAMIDAADLASVTHIVWRTAAAPGKQPALLTTATHFTVLDPDILAPNWGETIEGIQAGLSVDRASFNVGERVPLHIRWENVNATNPLRQGECGDPKPALEIQDSQHNVLRTIPTTSRCNGHGWGPFTVQKGKAQHTFRELTTVPPPRPPGITPAEADLPGPGVYYLVSVWSPRVLEEVPETAASGTVQLNSSRGRIGGVYATARSLSVRVEVVPSSNP